MRSAYSVLGVDGNAKPTDIEVAFRVHLAKYTREKLAEDPGAADRLSELENAYKVLRSPDMRAAHDRKLAQAVSTEPLSSWVEVRSPERKETTWSPRLALILVTLAVVICGGGYRLALWP